jgi:hypothetical protein
MRLVVGILLLALAALATPAPAKAQELTCTEFEFGTFDCIEGTQTTRYEWESPGPGWLAFWVPHLDTAPNWAVAQCLNRFDPPLNVNGVLIQDVYHTWVKVFMPYVGASGLLHQKNLDCRTQAPGPVLLAQEYYYWGGGYYWEWDLSGLYCSSMMWLNACGNWQEPWYWYLMGWY